MRKRSFFALFWVIWACVPPGQSSMNSSSNPKVLSFTDKTYEPQIRTVLLHPPVADVRASLQPAVTKIGDWNLLLSFDDLVAERDNYYVKILHCNFDWTKSIMMDLEFMEVYNEFPINNFEYSVDSHIPYIHYWFQVPEVKLPGNYLLIVYRNSDRDDLILSKRFMVFDNKVGFQNERNLVGASNLARINQQLNFTISYKGLEVINPLDNIKVVIRQNQRWDNMASDIKPSFVREIEKEIEYRYFDDKKMFKGGNEFRFFDLRSIGNPGRNVDRVNTSVRPVEVYIQKDKPRGHEVYGQYPDFNGGFVLDNLDYRDATFTNYAYINFTLASKPLAGDVYVAGGFHQWNLDAENKMAYDTASQAYKCRILLKQGWYDYQYLLKSSTLTPYHLEGSHFETENLYEIFVYYRPFQPKADLLVGYLQLGKNRR